MTPEQRCAHVFHELISRGLSCLVMGGHAVRFYGIDRNTIDYDFVVAADHWDSLDERLGAAPVLGEEAPREGPSWRPGDFRRFRIGTWPDGREERLEFWRKNHLLSPFPDLHSRRRKGEYGGGQVEFVGLDDLLRSKETEREDDWRDISLLEEIADQDALDGDDPARAIGRLRSRRGFQLACERGALSRDSDLTTAAGLGVHPVTAAFLLPFATERDAGPLIQRLPAEVRETVADPLRAVGPGTPRHIALVEVVRRIYKRAAMAADREDKRRAAPPSRLPPGG